MTIECSPYAESNEDANDAPLIRKVRFWTRWNGSWVKLTLVRGEELELHCSERTEEGWKSTHEVFEFDGFAVTLFSEQRARDCDGTHCTRSQYECDAKYLQSEHPFYPDCLPEGTRLPAWRQVR